MKNDISAAIEHGVNAIRENGFKPNEILMSDLTFDDFEKENNIFNIVIYRSNCRFMGIPVTINNAIPSGQFFITKSSHGGTRPGAGRPESEIKRRYRSVWLSDDEFEKVKKFISELRKK